MWWSISTVLTFVTHIVTYNLHLDSYLQQSMEVAMTTQLCFFPLSASQISDHMNECKCDAAMSSAFQLCPPPPPFITNLSFLWEKENKCTCNAETQWEKWMFSFWKVDIFFWGGGAKNTPNSVPSRYGTLITHLTLLPGVSSSLSEWLTCLSVLGWKQETYPPFWGGTTDWHLECSSPLLMSICWANLQ